MSRLLVMVAPSNHKIFASSLWSSNFSYDPDKMRLTISWVIWTFCLPIKSLMCTYLCKKGEVQVRTAKEKKEIGESGYTDSSHFFQYFPHERHLWQTRPLTIMKSTSTSALRQSGVLGIPVLKTQSIALLAVQHRWSQFLQGRTWICCEASFQIIRGGVKYNSNGYAISLLSVYSVWCSIFLKASECLLKRLLKYECKPSPLGVVPRLF